MYRFIREEFSFVIQLIAQVYYKEVHVTIMLFKINMLNKLG